MAKEAFKTLFCLLLMSVLMLINYNLYYTHTEQQLVPVRLFTGGTFLKFSVRNVSRNASQSESTYIAEGETQEGGTENRMLLSTLSTDMQFPQSNLAHEPKSIDDSPQIHSTSSAAPSSQQSAAGQEMASTKSYVVLPKPNRATMPRLDQQGSNLSVEVLSNGVRVISIPNNAKPVLRPILIPGIFDNTTYNREAARAARHKRAVKTYTTPPRSEATPPLLPPVDPATHEGGYVLVMKFYEQQTMASGNLLQLQCWANYLSLAVVKPLLYESYMLTPLDSSKHSFMLNFESVFDVSHWNEHALNERYAPLVDWDTFLRKAPRNVIYVQFKHPLIKTVKSIKAQGLPFPHPPEGDQFQNGCKLNTLTWKKFAFLSSAGFRIVRKVCFNFQLGDELALEEFNRHLLGGYASSQVTVIMDEWHGLGESQRVLIKEKICVEKIAFREEVRPSQQIVQDAERYAKKYLNESNYLAVITRFEMTGLTRGTHANNDYRIIPRCMDLTLEKWRELKAKNGINSTFLSIDIGRYGSSSFEKRNYYGHLQDMMDFVGDIYEGKLGVLDWERTFEDTSSARDAGYIALLQQVLVTRAKCLLFVGGGSFQRHTLHLYQQLHPREEDQCVTVLVPCTSAYRPVE